MAINLSKINIGIIGLGYVGLPLAIELNKYFNTIGYDINQKRVDDLNIGKDLTGEFTNEELNNENKLEVTSDLNFLKSCNFYIVTVPTPVDLEKKPDLNYLINATDSLSSILKKEDIVVFESTVYPGAIEEVCVPILEKNSQLKFNQDFYVGYSPERINPGDKKHKLNAVVKITSGSTAKTTEVVDAVYKKIIKAGTHIAPSIKTAEAAKVIENIQRDVNIALINELSLIFKKLGLDTEEVLSAAATKWNFNKYHPGLVGGHCISVDPYYLAYKSELLDHYPKMILSGREVNDSMSSFVVEEIKKSLEETGVCPQKSSILCLGLSFKANCSDTRNSGIIKVVQALKELGFSVDSHDPHINKHEVLEHYKIKALDEIQKKYDLILFGVGHDYYVKNFEEILKISARKNTLIFDLYGCLPKEKSDFRL